MSEVVFELLRYTAECTPTGLLAKFVDSIVEMLMDLSAGAMHGAAATEFRPRDVLRDRPSRRADPPPMNRHSSGEGIERNRRVSCSEIRHAV